MRKYRHFISLGLLLCAVVFAQLAPPAFAQQYVTTPAAVSPEKQLTPAEAKARQEWRKSMLQIPAPSGECQRATFPNRKWEKVPCTTAPQVPFFPAPKRHPFTLGGTGGDFVTSVTGVIVSAEGAFAGAGQGAGALNNVTVSGGTDPAIDNVTGAYSLMLNTSPLPAAGLCPNTLPDCGWEQFIFMNGTDGTAKAFIQFWLIGVASKNGCPNDTWNYFPGAPQSSPGCWINSRAVDIPLQPVTNIPSLSLTGTAVVGGRDTVALATEEAIYRPAADENQDLNLAGNWHQFEFNVVGPGSGSQANFNQGATLAVRTSVLNGAGIGPDQCPQSFTNPPPPPMGVPTGFTAESNNMTLGALPCQVLSTPGISFVEGVAPKIISISPSIGDENGGTQVTINGEGLSPNGEVAFGTTFVGVSSCQSSSQCTVFSPPGSAPVHMGYVNLADGSPGPESNLVAFKFAPFPNGTMSPSKGPTSGGTHVTVNGRNFATAPRATTITFDLNGVATPALDVACSSDTSCTMITPPPNEPGVDPIVAPVSITVGGETAQLGSFTYTDNGPPPPPNRGCQPGDCVGEKCCTIFNSDGNVIGKRCIPANRFCPVQN